jgi:ATP-binding cassette, subfamily B (MDR/TAP), member 1
MAAAEKIFKMINTPSKIDALADDEESKNKTETSENFRGEIEFKNVWFRYPSRLDDWVFKGLNLKIEKDMCIAIVGESGSGKSTFINLVMRFYDPEIGQVLIDGVDVKDYRVADLRSKIGLVMQEPTLFNYSIKDNILYGQHKASNQDIHNAATIANALEFVESTDLKNAFEDNAVALHEEFVKRDSAMR